MALTETNSFYGIILIMGHVARQSLFLASNDKFILRDTVIPEAKKKSYLRQIGTIFSGSFAPFVKFEVE